MSLRKTVWLSACVLSVFILAFLRLLNILGSEYDLLIRWVSAISLLLSGILIGTSISEKKIQVRGMLASLLLFLVGFCAAPFVGVGGTSTSWRGHYGLSGTLHGTLVLA